MDRNWTVLLIGGSGAVGKSHLARQLSEYFKIPLTEVDDIRIALQQVVGKDTHPDLYFFLENANFLSKFPTNVLANKLFRLGEEILPALEALIGKHIACNEPVIFEGDSIIPKLIAQINQDKIKAVFIYDEKESLLEREQNRARGEVLDSMLLEKQAEFSYQYGQLIKQQSEKYKLDILKASPIDTLLDRTLQLINQDKST